MSKRKRSMIDMKQIPTHCGNTECSRPVEEKEWLDCILPGAVLKGFKIAKGITFKCPSCGSDMYVGILP